jgi:histidyl-tRNA synthetase
MTDDTKPVPEARAKPAAKPAVLTGVKGMNDLLPADAHYWEMVDEAVRDWTRGYGYQQIRTPIVESTALFARGIGSATDIVEKEMYSFVDALNGEHLTLRPENTAGVVRSVIEHHLTYEGPRRLWYFGPMFRHERPQRGRYRQFHQIGIEAIGFEGPDIDAEVIAMAQRLWDDLGLDGLQLELNSIGDAGERLAHRAALIDYFEQHLDQLDDDSKRRLHANPMRILDSKNPALQTLIEAAPKPIDHLGTASRAHFEGLQQLLADLGIPYRLNPRLVRGLDYYNRTVFEWTTTMLGAQGTVCGGGRYDPLVEQMGGKSTPACGFAIGVERLIELLREQGEAVASAACSVYVVHQGQAAGRLAFRSAERLRDAGLDVILHCGGGSFKSQFKRADASGATLAVVIGEEEAARDEAAIKWLRSDKNDLTQHNVQQNVALADLPNTVLDALYRSNEEGHGLRS